MGIISPTNKNQEKIYTGSKKALAEAMSYAANQIIESPIDGSRMTMWQAVVKRLYNTAIYAESDKDATSAAKVIAERLFGRAPVQKQENKHDIPTVILAMKNDDLKAIEEKAARAEAEDDEDSDYPIGIQFEDGSEAVL